MDVLNANEHADEVRALLSNGLAGAGTFSIDSARESHSIRCLSVLGRGVRKQGNRKQLEVLELTPLRDCAWAGSQGQFPKGESCGLRIVTFAAHRTLTDMFATHVHRSPSQTYRILHTTANPQTWTHCFSALPDVVPTLEIEGRVLPSLLPATV